MLWPSNYTTHDFSDHKTIHPSRKKAFVTKTHHRQGECLIDVVDRAQGHLVNIGNIDRGTRGP